MHKHITEEKTQIITTRKHQEISNLSSDPGKERKNTITHNFH